MEIDEKRIKVRWIIVFVILGILAAYILFIYGKLSFTPVEKNVINSVKVERGSILDSSGKPLALSTSFYHVGVKKSAIENYKSKVVSCLALPLKMTREELLSIIDNATSDFVYLKKRISESDYEYAKYVLKQNNLNYLVSFDEVIGRVYPENALASQVIGFMGDAGIGLSGMEYSMQSVLAPELQPVDSRFTPSSRQRSTRKFSAINASK